MVTSEYWGIICVFFMPHFLVHYPMSPIRPRRLFTSGRKRKRVFSQKKRKRVSQIAKRVLQRNAEWKASHTGITGSATTSGSLNSVCEISQGDTDSTRDGDQLTMGTISYYLRLVQSSGVGADTYNNIRVIIFQWYPQSVPAVTDIVNTTSGLGTMFHYNTDKAKSFKIIKDKNYLLQTKNSDGVPAVVQFGRRHKVRIGRKKIQFVSGGTTGSNKVYFLFLSDSSVTPHPQINCYVRTNFMDV